jgi:phosphotransferase system  glucose/maltose/N-acetylglucosamine-specific IIC component
MPLPRYQAGSPESRTSLVATTLVGSAVMIGFLLYLGSRFQGHDRIGGVLLVALGLFFVLFFTLVVLTLSKKRKGPNKAPEPTPEAVTPRATESKTE